MKVSFREILEDTPIIASVKNMEGLEKCLDSDIQVVFVLFGDICNIASIVKKIKDAGKMDAPGRPTMYEVSDKFYKMFGIGSLDELPELPKYKLDENQQIVIDEYIENVEAEDNTSNNSANESELDEIITENSNEDTIN